MERHRLRSTLLLLLASAFLGVATPAAAQFMFLDVNGDGACTSADILLSSVTSVESASARPATWRANSTTAHWKP